MARIPKSGREIADAVGITPSAFYDKMAGRTEFKRSEMFKIQELFFRDSTLEYLFKLDDSKNLVPEKEDIQSKVIELINFQKKMKDEKN